MRGAIHIYDEVPMFENFTRKLMTLDRAEEKKEQLPSAIFGTAISLSQGLEQRQPVRIGMWPSISKEHPYVAMGLMITLSLYLERWTQIRTYPLFVKLSGDPASYMWRMADSQFELEDWEIESLDDNVGMWGSLSKSADTWKWTIDYESDLEDDDNNSEPFQISGATLQSLISQIPVLAEKIADSLDVNGTTTTLDMSTNLSDDDVIRWLQTLFEWGRDLLLYLWGAGDDESIKGAFARLQQDAKQDSFVAWSFARSVAYAMKPGFGSISTFLHQHAIKICEQFADYPLVPTTFAPALYRAKEVSAAFDILETAVKRHSSVPSLWLTLAELHRSSGKFDSALYAFQRAIEEDATDFSLYVRYASLLTVMDYDGWQVDDFVLTDIDRIDQDHLLWEIIEAYDHAIKLEPDRLDVREQQLLKLIDVSAQQRLWDQFNILVVQDSHGEHVRSVIEAMYDLPDAYEALSILETRVGQDSENCQLLVSLGAALLLNDDFDKAQKVLEKAESLDDGDYDDEIAHLLLSIDEPDFEMRISELKGIVDAGNALAIDDVEYLEDILEKVPTFAEVYVVLGKAYLIWDEDETALETLLDGNQQIPNDPDIVALLSQVLWNSDEKQLAIRYLEQAAFEHPLNVELLCLLGERYFEMDERAISRAYLRRAEVLAPRHPFLSRTRKRIAQYLQEDSEKP